VKFKITSFDALNPLYQEGGYDLRMNLPKLKGIRVSGNYESGIKSFNINHE
jgi:hypothetical protein